MCTACSPALIHSAITVGFGQPHLSTVCTPLRGREWWTATRSASRLCTLVRCSAVALHIGQLQGSAAGNIHVHTDFCQKKYQFVEGVVSDPHFPVGWNGCMVGLEHLDVFEVPQGPTMEWKGQQWWSGVFQHQEKGLKLRAGDSASGNDESAALDGACIEGTSDTTMFQPRVSYSYMPAILASPGGLGVQGNLSGSILDGGEVRPATSSSRALPAARHLKHLQETSQEKLRWTAVEFKAMSPTRYLYVPAEYVHPALVTHYIKNAADLDHLQYLLMNYAAILNPIHVSAAFSRMVQLRRGKGLRFQDNRDTRTSGEMKMDHTQVLLYDIIHDLLRALEGSKGTCTPRESSNILWCLAVLEYSPDSKAITFLVQSVLMQAHRATSQALASSMYAVSCMPCALTSIWISELGGKIQARMNNMDIWALARIIHALAVAGVSPPARWMYKAEAALLEGLPGRDHDPRLLSSIVWSLGSLRYVSYRLLKATELCILQGRTACGPREGATILWGMAMSSYRPGSLLITRICTLDFSRCLTKELAMILYAFARMNMPPPEPWTAAALGFMMTKMAEASPRDVMTMIWSLATLNIPPRSIWMEEALKKLDGSWKQIRAEQFAICFWSLAQLRYVPPCLEGMLEEVHLRLTSFSGAHLSMMVWSLSTLRVSLSAAFMEGFSEVVLRKVEELKSRELAMLLWAYAHQDYRPDDPFIKAVLLRLRTCMSSFGQPEFVLVTWSLGKLSWRPGAWVAEFLLDTLKSRVDCLDPKSMACVLHGFAKMQLCPPRSVMCHVVHVIERQMPALGPCELVSMIWSIYRLSYWPPKSWLKSFAHRFVSVLSRCGPRELAIVLWVMAGMSCPLDAAELHALRKRLMELGSSMSSKDIGMTEAALDVLEGRKALVHVYQGLTHHDPHSSDRLLFPCSSTMTTLRAS